RIPHPFPTRRSSDLPLTASRSAKAIWPKPKPPSIPHERSPTASFPKPPVRHARLPQIRNATTCSRRSRRKNQSEMRLIFTEEERSEEHTSELQSLAY